MSHEPKKHHYIPIFYLKQWATGRDGRLCEYSKPYRDIVKPKRVHPSGTGYVDRLYELQGLESELAQRLESEFMAPIDGFASEIVKGYFLDRNHFSSARQRTSWSMFIISLIMRNPEEIALAKNFYVKSWNNPTEERKQSYLQRRGPGMPATLVEFLETCDPVAIERSSLENLAQMIENPVVANHISGMLWGILSFPLGNHALLTSDRPVIMSNGLNKPDSHIILPISPSRAFYAVTTEKTQNFLAETRPTELIERINRTVTAQAVKYVYSTSDIQLKYIQKHMGKQKLPAFFERMQQYGPIYNRTNAKESSNG